MNHSLEQDTNAESYLDKIAQVIKESTNKYFPTKQVKRREPKKSWITNRITRLIVNRDKQYQLWIKRKSKEDYENYKKKRIEVNMEVKKAKRNEIQTKIEFSKTIIRKNISDM